MINTPELSRSKIVLYNFCIILIITSHLYGMLMLGLNYIFHIITTSSKTPRWKIVFQNIKQFGIIFVLCFILWWNYSFGVDKSYMASSSNGGTFAFIKPGFISITRNVIGNLLGCKYFYILLLGWSGILFLPKDDRNKMILLNILLIILPIILILISCIKYNYWFLQRLFIWCVPYFILSIGWACDSLIIQILQIKKSSNTT